MADPDRFDSLLFTAPMIITFSRSSAKSILAGKRGQGNGEENSPAGLDRLHWAPNAGSCRKSRRSCRIVALAAGNNRDLLEQQVRRFRPELAVLKDPAAAAELKHALRDLDCRVEAGPEGLVAAARWPSADMVVNALVGFTGFVPTLEALEAGKTVALANKETLVAGGELLARRGLLDLERVFPLDSEHSAIYQSLGGVSISQVSRIWLTASGGPFRDWEEGKLSGHRPKRWPIAGPWGRKYS